MRNEIDKVVDEWKETWDSKTQIGYSELSIEDLLKSINKVALPKDEYCYGCQEKEIKGKNSIMCSHCTKIYSQGFDYGTDLEKKDSISKDVLLGKIFNMKNNLNIATYQTPLSKDEKVWVDFMRDSIKAFQKDLLGDYPEEVQNVPGVEDE